MPTAVDTNENNEKYLDPVIIRDQDLKSDVLEPEKKKCVIILALSILPRSPGDIRLKDSRHILDKTVPKINVTSGDEEEAYYGAYQLEAIPKYIIARAHKDGCANIEFIILATDQTKKNTTDNNESNKHVYISEECKDEDYKPHCWRRYQCGEGENALSPTASELFRKRIREYVRDKELDVKLFFNEQSISDEARKDMPELMKTIRKEVGPEDEVYVDIHGGLRATQQLLVNLLSVLREEGTEINPDHILTIDGQWAPIKVAGEGFRITDLVSGIHEFTNYGRMQSLNRFYGRTESAPQVRKDLLDTMQDVSSAIQLCDMAWFDELLPELAKRLENFRASKVDSGYLQSFLNLIESGYYPLIQRNEITKKYDVQNDATTEIKWCRDKGLYQQMLTICESTVPKYLVEHNVIAFDEFIQFNGNKERDPFELNNYLFNQILTEARQKPKKDDDSEEITPINEDYVGSFGGGKAKTEAFFTIKCSDSAKDLREMLDLHFALKDMRNHSNHGSRDRKSDKGVSEPIDDLVTKTNRYIELIQGLAKDNEDKDNLGPKGEKRIVVTGKRHMHSDITEADIVKIDADRKQLKEYLESKYLWQNLEDPKRNIRDLHGIGAGLMKQYELIYYASQMRDKKDREQLIKQKCSRATRDLWLLICRQQNENMQLVDSLKDGTKNDPHKPFHHIAADRLGGMSFRKPDLVTGLANKPYHS